MADVSKPADTVTAASVRMFYERISAATLPGTPGSVDVVASEFNGAKAALAGTDKAVFNKAVRNAIEAVGAQMDSKQVAAFNKKSPLSASVVRGQNDYVMATMTREIEKSGVNTKELRAVMRLEAKKMAVREAIEGQVGDTTERDDVLELVDSAERAADVEFIRRAWTVAAERDEKGEVVLNEKSVQSLEIVFKKFQSSTAPVGKAEEYAGQVAKPGSDGKVASKPLPENIGGLTVAEFEKRLNEMMSESSVRRKVLSADKIRVGGYQQIVKDLLSNKIVQGILPQFKKDLIEAEKPTKQQQLMFDAKVLTKESLPRWEGMKPYYGAMYDLAQDVGERLGFGEPVTVVVPTSNQINAFIYTSDLTKPRVTVYSGIVDKLWDTKGGAEGKGGWLAVWVDKAGKPVDKGTEGAKEIPVGKRLMEALVSHELGHIRDQVTLYMSLVSYLYDEAGVDIFGAQDETEKRGRQKKRQDGIAALKKQMNHSAFGSGRGYVAPDRLRKTSDRGGFLTPDQARSVLQDVFDSELGAEVTVNSNMQQDPCWTEFQQNMQNLSRMAETTADRYPVIMQQDPKWGSLLDTMLHLDAVPNVTNDQKRDIIQHAISQGGPYAVAKAEMEQIAANVTPAEATAMLERNSHPFPPTRVLSNYHFSGDKKLFYQHHKQFQELPADQRLVGVIQLYEAEVTKLEKEVKGLKLSESYNGTADLIQQYATASKIKEVEAKMKPFLDFFMDTVVKDGLGNAENPALESALGIMMKRGVKLGDKTHFSRTLLKLQDALTAVEKDRTLTAVEHKVVRARLQSVEGMLKKYDSKWGKKDAEYVHLHSAAATYH